MKTKLDLMERIANEVEPDEIERLICEELETAWLRGWVASRASGSTLSIDERNRWAADYADRVVGGPTKPERPA